jgi:tetratricopeptide (TPR) repeat protein
MKHAIRICMMTLMFFVPVFAAVAQEADLDHGDLQQLLNEANRFFHGANEKAPLDPEAARDLYQKSILRFERIIRGGGIQNGRIYYNLANAYFLAGDIGHAIVNYHRAARYMPNDPLLHQNLDWVRQQRADRIEEPERTRILKTIFFWHYDLTTRIRTLLFALFFFTLWGLASARLFRRHYLINWGIGITIVLSAALFTSLTAEAIAHHRDDTGVIVAGEVTARKGNGMTYQPAFEAPLHAGVEFSMREQRDDWYRIALRDGRECWIPADAAELVRAPLQ